MERLGAAEQEQIDALRDAEYLQKLKRASER